MRDWCIGFSFGMLLSACGADAGGALSRGTRSNVIYVGSETNLTTETGTGITTENTTGITTKTDVGVGVGDAKSVGTSTGDVGPVASWTVDQVFPTCQGTVDQVSECIINLPSKFGIPVTSAPPMDFNACKP